MRITHICLAGLVTDGLNYQDNLLTKYHRKIGHDVTIITSKWIWGTDGKMARDERESYINENDVRVVRLEMFGRDDFNRKFKKYRGLLPEIEKSKPDVLFIHGVSFRDTTVIASYLSKHPTVIAYVDNHADFSNSATNWLSKNILHKIIWRSYANRLLPYVKTFYGVLPVRVDFLSDVYGIPKNRCKLLVLGADDELVAKANMPEIRTEIRNKHGIEDSDYLIITGGKIDAWKVQTLYLLEAVRNIEINSVKLIVFGSVADELKDKFYSLIDGIKIQYIGWIDSQKSYEYFAASDLAVFPGRHSVLWEQAVAQGTPILVKDWPGTHHIDLGGNAKFLEEDSPVTIQNAIEQIINNPEEYQKMKLIAREKGMKEFSYHEIALRSLL